MDDLIAFLRAQWDDEESDAHWSLENAPSAHQTDPNSMNFSPERVLRDVAAKRRILDEYTSAAEWADTLRLQEKPSGESEAHARHAGSILIVLRLLALPYADEDGYREEWRPDHG